MSKEKPRINHLLFIDDLRLNGRSEWEPQSLVHTAQIISTDIGMKFDMENYKILLICRYKVIEIDYIKMQDEDCIKHEEHDRSKYLGVIKDGRIKTAVMKEKIERKYFPRARKCYMWDML